MDFEAFGEALEKLAETAVEEAINQADIDKKIEDAIEEVNFDKLFDGEIQHFNFDEAIDNAIQNHSGLDEAAEKAVEAAVSDIDFDLKVEEAVTLRLNAIFSDPDPEFLERLAAAVREPSLWERVCL